MTKSATAASTRKIYDWLKLVRQKPINLAPIDGNRLSQLNLLNHFNTYKKEIDVKEDEEEEKEPRFEDFMEWLVNKADYSQK